MTDTTQFPQPVTRAKALLQLQEKLEHDDSVPLVTIFALHRRIAEVPDDVLGQARLTIACDAPATPERVLIADAPATSKPTPPPKPKAKPTPPPKPKTKPGRVLIADAPATAKPTPPQPKATPEPAAAAATPTAPPRPTASAPASPPKPTVAAAPTAPPRPTTAAPKSPPAPARPTTRAPVAETAPGVPRGTWRGRKVKAGLAIRSDDLGALRSDDSSGFEEIYALISEYEAAQPEEKFGPLQTLDRKATEWLNQPGQPGPLKDERRAVVYALTEQAATEQRRLSKTDAGKRYLGNVEKSRVGADYNSADPDEKYAFKALTNTSADDVRTKVLRPAQKHPLQEAYDLLDSEMAAIRIFTNVDYGYINPATKVDMEWLESNKSKVGSAPAFSRTDATDADRMAEGPVHVGMAVDGLRKLPADPRDVYRGATTNMAEVDKWCQEGFEFRALASASVDRSTAVTFAKNNTSPNEPVEIIFLIHDSGGRDIHELSVYQNENEVTIIPGSKFRVNSKQDISPQGTGRTVYELELSPA